MRSSGSAGLATIERPDGPAASARRRSPAILVELLVVLAAGVATFVHLRNTFFFSNDDLVQFSVATNSGVSWELLGLNVFGHFAPANRLGHLVFLQWAGLDLTVGAVAMAGLVVVLLLVLLWCCHELHLSPVRRVLVVGVFGLSSGVLETAVWMDGAVHTLPTLAVTYAVLATHLRGLSTGRWRWHVVSVVLFAAGLLTQVRAGMALPLVVLADLLLVGMGAPWRDRLTMLRRVAVPIAAMTVIAAAAGYWIVSHYGTDGGARPPLDVVAQTVVAAFTGALWPGLVGVMPTLLPTTGVQAVVGGTVLVVAAALVAYRRINAGPLLFGAAAFVLYYGFLAFSGLLTADTIAASVLRFHYLVFVTVPVLLALVHLRLPGLDSERRTVASTRIPVRVRRGMAWSAALAVLVVVAGTGAAYVSGDRWDRARAGHAYEENVAAGRDEWAREDTTVLPLLSPEPVAGSWAEGLGRHESLLAMYEPGFTPPPMRDRVVVLDDGGRVRPVALADEASGRPIFPSDGESACVDITPQSDPPSFVLDRAVTGAPLFAALTYSLTAGGAEVVRTTGAARDAQEVWHFSTWPVTLPEGRHRVFIPLQSDEVLQVALTQLPVGASLCVSDVTVVRPLHQVEGSCFRMDEYGARGARTDCPVSDGAGG